MKRIIKERLEGVVKTTGRIDATKTQIPLAFWRLVDGKRRYYVQRDTLRAAVGTLDGRDLLVPTLRSLHNAGALIAPKNADPVAAGFNGKSTETYFKIVGRQ
jgi:hypothetical protein